MREKWRKEEKIGREKGGKIINYEEAMISKNSISSMSSSLSFWSATWRGTESRLRSGGVTTFCLTSRVNFAHESIIKSRSPWRNSRGEGFWRIYCLILRLCPSTLLFVRRSRSHVSGSKRVNQTWWLLAWLWSSTLVLSKMPLATIFPLAGQFASVHWYYLTLRRVLLQW